MKITTCEQCGGVKSITYSPAHDTSSVAVPPMKFCCGHGPPQGGSVIAPPAPEHDGKLDEDDTHHVYYNNFGGIAISAHDVTWMTAKEALSLLAWLRQEEEALKQLAGGDEV